MMRFLYMLSILLLAACTSAQHVRIKTDEYSKTIEVVGIRDFSNPFGKRMPHKWFLRSFINTASHTVKHQLYFEITYSSHSKYFKYAADDTSTSLKVTPLYKVDCLSEACERMESLSIDVDENVLRQHQATGYRVKVFAKSGDQFILVVSPDMIQQQLKAVAQSLHALPANH